MATRDGFCLHNGGSQLRHGLKCAGAVIPKTNLKDNERQTYDVIVVGAGYAGLTACRDLCTAGFNVLLLEGRDRIGGRTYTGEVDGHLYEMGGTWVHWSQPHTWREMVRYGFTELLPSHARDKGVNYYTTFFRGKPSNIEHSMAHTMTEKAFRMLCDVDGKLGREAMPYPHNPHFNPEAKLWDGMSVAQRLEQVKDSLTEDESAILQARLTSVCGTGMDKAGFFDVLRWWALGGYSMEGLYESGDEYKLPTGQSSFARCFFEEALETGNLTYSFDTAVASIKDEGNCIVVNDAWQARRLICTVPMNVLHSIRFHPALSAEKIAATTGGNINQGAKVHLEVSGTDLRSWSSAVWPVVRACSASGDGLTPAGNTHIVCFGANSTFSSPEEDARDFVAHVERLHDMKVEKTIWHNWSIDPFSQGSWCMYPPNHSFEHLEALQQRQGNVLFANADWASGWRGYIDGAIERGGIAARDVSRELSAANK